MSDFLAMMARERLESVLRNGAREPVALDASGLGISLRRFEGAVDDVVEPLASQPNRPVM